MVTDRRLLTRVALRNYKSIAACDVSPAQLSFLVGPNGAGKSNFLDALRFVADALQSSLGAALSARDGIGEVLHRSDARAQDFGIRFDFQLASAKGRFILEVGAQPGGGYVVRREECFVAKPSGDSSDSYRIEAGRVVGSTIRHPPACGRDSLYLRNVSGLPEFRPAYDALVGMAVYNLNVDALRALQPPEPLALLKRDGGNIASVLQDLGTRSPGRKESVEEYLAVVVPGLDGVDVRALGPSLALEFRHATPGAGALRRFFANSMSDGTLRALGALVALFQCGDGGVGSPSLVGIEEPEGALHPGAAGALADALADASGLTQVLVTSHSADLLDRDDIQERSILAFSCQHGETKIGLLDRAGRSVLRDRQFTAGELLRIDQLRPDPDSASPDRGDRFGGDQPALTARFDLERARRGAPSFRKLWRAVTELLL